MWLGGKLFWAFNLSKNVGVLRNWPDSSAVSSYESLATCFVWVIVGVYYDGLVLFFFLFLVLFDSSVSILSRRLNLFLVSAVWFGRVDAFNRSHPANDGGMIHFGLWHFNSWFELPNLDEGGRIGDLRDLTLQVIFFSGE